MANEQFGEEWKNEMRKLTKEQLIELFEFSARKRNEKYDQLKSAVADLLDLYIYRKETGVPKKEVIMKAVHNVAKFLK